SFCMNLIRENFHLLGIRHDFDIADEVKLYLLKKNALEDVLERKYSSSDIDFFETVDAFGGKKNDDKLSEVILSVYNFAESLPDPIGWLNNVAYFFDKDDSYIPYKDIIVKNINQQLTQIKNEYKNALDAISSDSELASYYDIYYNEYNFFVNVLDKGKLDKICNLSFERLPRKGKDADPSTSEYVKNIRDNAKSIIKKIYDLCTYTDVEIIKEIELIKPFIKTICNLVIEFKSEFSANKRKENILDFNDLEHFAIMLLEENSEIREYMKNFYKEILVDEYQDTNGVQAYLFELLSNGKNLFMVGDVKQSIYGFRNSNPKYFIDKYNVFGFDENDQGIKINLAKNFRSSNNIINVVNNYFVKLMIGELGGVTYNEEHSLVYGNDSIKDADNSIERYVINTKSDVSDDLEIDKVQAEAIFTANRIIELVEKEKPEIFDKNINGYRPLTYKDIVVLMRKTKGIASVYADILGERGIPVYTAESGGYFNCIEIATVISFLKVIENPLQDIPLLAIMRSPVFGFDDNFIAQIRAENRKIRLYNLLKKSRDDRVTDFVKYIDELRDFAVINNVGAVVRKIVFDTGYYQFAGGMTNGEVRMLNLNLLCERADKF
ncbi:MAG: UvrD-helicase domain-containing protein, partial [Clostridia bacterium]|nr:UvrD-helicase domain-containing protein [Clostridia bacterium]